MTCASPSSGNTVSLEQLVAFNDEIAALVRAGVPLELGLKELGRDAVGALGEISASLASRMSAGTSLVEALEAEERRMPTEYRAVIEAGARAGRLPAALEAVSNFARELVELRRQIGMALLYPLIVCLLAYGLFVVFIVDLTERFRDTYETFRLPLHGMLGALVWMVHRLAWWWWVPPAALAALIVWWVLTGRAGMLSGQGVARGLGWVPGVRYFRYAHFAELLALLAEHEVPLSDALRLSSDATGDQPLRLAARELAAVVERGGTVSDRDYRAFGLPPFLHWTLSHAGRGGQAARLLSHAAAVYRRRGANAMGWFKVLFPLLVALPLAFAVTLLYALTLFVPLATFWKDLT
ncbi:MAG: type II secretion system F family protein [Planctomycetaceae bacterium]